MGVITMGGLTAQPSSRLAHVASMGASSMGAEKAKAEKKERRRSSVKKARFAEEAPPPAPAVEAPKPAPGGGLAGSTFKSRMRDRETRQERARIAQNAETETPIHTLLEDKSKQTVQFPPGTPKNYTPPATAANGIPQTFASRQIRRAGRAKREIFEAAERDGRAHGPFCAAQRRNTAFGLREGHLGVQWNRRLQRRAKKERGLGAVAPSVREAALEAALDGRDGPSQGRPALGEPRDEPNEARSFASPHARSLAAVAAGHRGSDAACAVWRALWTARRRRGHQEKQERGGTLPEFDGFVVSDAVLYEHGAPKKWLFSDALTGKLLRKAPGNVAFDAIRARCARVGAAPPRRHEAPDARAAAGVALLLYEGSELKALSAAPEEWEAVQHDSTIVAVVASVPGVRVQHSWRHDTPKTKALIESKRAHERGAHADRGGETRYAPLRSSVVKKHLDVAVRHLVRAVEAGAGVRVRSLTTVWALDERRSTAVAEPTDEYVASGDAPRLPAPPLQFERAVDVEFLQPLHRSKGSVAGDSDAGGGSVVDASPSQVLFGPAVHCHACPGGLCGWRAAKEKEEDDRERDDDDASEGDEEKKPAKESGRMMLARSAIESAAREAATGDALDYWPQNLVAWCLAERATRGDGSPGKRCRPIVDVAWTTPSVGLAFPKANTVVAPGQILAVTWVCRGPPPKTISIDLHLVPDAVDGEREIIEDDFLVSHRVLAVAADGAAGHFDWFVPLDVNGSNTRAYWRLTLAVHGEDGDPDGAPSPGRAAQRLPAPGDGGGADLVAVASPRFAIAKARDFSFGEAPPDARASKLDVDVAHAILQINDARRVALVDDTKVRRWDNVLVCGDCYEAYAELAQRRARWIAPHLVRRRKQLHDAALLCLEDSRALSPDEGRRARLAERRERRKETLALLSAPKATPRTKVRDRQLAASRSEPRLKGAGRPLPRVATDDVRGSVFVKNLPGAASKLRAETEAFVEGGKEQYTRQEQLLRWARQEQGLPPTPPRDDYDEPPPARPLPPMTPTGKLGSALLGALEPDARAADDASTAAASSAAVSEEPRRREPRKNKRGKRKPKRDSSRSYGDLLHPWQRLLRDQLALQETFASEDDDQPMDPLLASLMTPGVTPGMLSTAGSAMTPGPYTAGTSAYTASAYTAGSSAYTAGSSMTPGPYTAGSSMTPGFTAQSYAEDSEDYA